jgi:hypothetical protein
LIPKPGHDGLLVEKKRTCRITKFGFCDLRVQFIIVTHCLLLFGRLLGILAPTNLCMKVKLLCGKSTRTLSKCDGICESDVPAVLNAGTIQKKVYMRLQCFVSLVPRLFYGHFSPSHSSVSCGPPSRAHWLHDPHREVGSSPYTSSL